MTGVQLRLLLMTAKLVRRLTTTLFESGMLFDLHHTVIMKELDEAIRDVEQEEKHEQRG